MSLLNTVTPQCPETLGSSRAAANTQNSEGNHRPSGVKDLVSPFSMLSSRSDSHAFRHPLGHSLIKVCAKQAPRPFLRTKREIRQSDYGSRMRRKGSGWSQVAPGFDHRHEQPSGWSQVAPGFDHRHEQPSCVVKQRVRCCWLRIGQSGGSAK